MDEKKQYTMKTAEEIMQEHLDPHDCLRVSKCYEMTLDAMIEFAKLHVEAALKAASEKAKIDKSVTFGWEKVDRPSILKSYPLENIK
jgi:hypothetical protein